MKKLWLSSTGLVMMMDLAACGGGVSEGAAETERLKENAVEAATDKVELTYWYAWGDKIGENNENLVQRFNESQDEIHVTAEFQGTYDDVHSKTQAAFAAGNAPEVTQNEIASVQIFAKNGMIESLTPFIENDSAFDVEDFVSGLMENSYVDGEIYALPYLRSTPLLYMNATMAEEVGLDPAGPETWEEFKAYAEAFTNDEGRVGISMPVNLWFYEAFIAQAGGSMLNEEGTEVAFNSEEGAAAYDLWRNMAKAGTLTVPTGDEAGDKSIQDFVNGHAGMLFASTGNLSYLMDIAEEKGFELNTYFLPKGEEAKVPTGGANLVMTSGLDEEHQQAAWEFIKFMMAKEQTVYASEYTGYLPVRKSAMNSEAMQALYEEKPQFKVAVDQLKNATGRPMVEGYPEVVKILADEMTRGILDETLTTEDLLNVAAEKANTIIK
ncbi:ABC transporter substrate-binding protein [Planococcus lenghuensis]|uniref:ABC transporter substrate-binding protein n=1 Tax=Planococcus lenghuensis TaxID=2213202 RepID=A0A1Q2L4U5_9BACL|nr:ABC transporter substrate-binding protein [Planococcus lenghuensis]AQQ55470.1 ABC transporter substrate-binding protein [Planococcus lenghuensis]